MTNVVFCYCAVNIGIYINSIANIENAHATVRTAPLSAEMRLKSVLSVDRIFGLCTKLVRSLGGSHFEQTQDQYSRGAQPIF